MKKNLFIAMLSGLFFFGCETDFKVIAPYKEVVVIDGLLDALQPVQTIKISKAFLGEGNALVMAQQKDSINFADVLDVQLEKITSGSDIVIPLTRSELNDKEPGIFSSPFHVVYTTNTPIDELARYRIRVTNRNTGNVATSVTKIVRDADANPAIPGPNIDLAGAPLSPIIFTFVPRQNSNAVIYDLIVRFHYREIDPNGNSEEKSIDMNFEDKEFGQNDGEVKYYMYKNDFFHFVGDNIPDKPGFTRRIDSLSVQQAVEIIMVAGTEDLQTYIHLQTPNSGIVQERPLFTTVTNGLGLFTSRLMHSYFRKPNAASEAAFDTSRYTMNKNFRFN